MTPDQQALGESLETRTVSAFPLSIGTSIAFESIFKPRQTPYDPTRKIPEQVDINKYKECWINLYTLYRNIVGSISKEAFERATEHQIRDTLVFEIDVINSLFHNEGLGVCRPYYYYCTNESLVKEALRKNVQLRTDNTILQKAFNGKFHKAMELLFKVTDEHFKFDSSVDPKSIQPSLILSHVPHDLLSYHHFSKLDLLESHTGLLKPKFNWNTKYYPVGEYDMTILPFHRKLLYIFGDRILIKPTVYKLRQQIMDIAIKRKWTSFTTEAKFMQDFQIDVHELYVLEYLKKL